MTTGELGVELQHELFMIRLGNDEMKNAPNANKDVMDKVLRVQKEKGASPHHVLVVFQFPALQAPMKSTQVNAIDLDMSELSRMDVHSSFVVDFYDDVGVLTDVSTQVLFLPELLKSYFQVNDIPISAELKKGTHKADQRLYICDQWQVAPRIKCIERSAFTWNPPLVDDILRKLQSFDYRTTIPKALRRTILDPLDATIASVVFALLKLVTQVAKQGDRRRRRKTYHEAL